MKTKPLTFLLALTFLFLFCGSVFGDDLQDSYDAYKRKDYETAYKLWLPLTEQGNAKAQFIVATRHAAKQLAGKSFPDRPQ